MRGSKTSEQGSYGSVYEVSHLWAEDEDDDEEDGGEGGGIG